MNLEARTMHNVYVENLVKYRREKGSINRLMYLFIYDELTNETINLEEEFQKLIDEQNKGHHEDRISGFLLLYDRPVGFHLIEGTDMTILKHIQSLAKPTAIASWLKNPVVKVLMYRTHVLKRLFAKTWHCLEVTSPISPEETYATVEDKEAIYTTLMTCANIMKDVKEQLGLIIKNGDARSGEPLKARLTKKAEELVPSTPMLIHLMRLPLLEDLFSYENIMDSLPPNVPCHEVVWPMPLGYLPDYRDILLVKKKEEGSESRK